MKTKTHPRFGRSFYRTLVLTQVFTFLNLCAFSQDYGQQSNPYYNVDTPFGNKISEKVINTFKEFPNTNTYDLTTNTSTSPSPLLEQEVEVNLAKSSFVSYENETEIKEMMTQSPKILTVILPILDSIVIVDLVQADFFTDSFSVVSSGEGTLDVDLGIHYQGIIRGMPNTFIGMSFFENEFTFFGSSINSNTTVEGGLSVSQNNTENFHVFYKTTDVTIDLGKGCGSQSLQQYQDAKEHIITQQQPMTNSAVAAIPCVTYFWETSYNMYQTYGSNANVTTHMTSVFNNFQLLLSNEGIGSQLNQLYIWSTPDSYNNSLQTFSNNRSNFNSNLAVLFSSTGGGGVAWLDVLCNQSELYRHAFCGSMAQTVQSVPNYSWPVMVTTHEVGHNLGSPHTHACAWNGNNTAIDGCGPQAGYDEGCSAPLPPAGGTMMSYCHLVNGVGIDLGLGFGTQPGSLILSRVNNCITLTCNSGGAPIADFVASSTTVCAGNSVNFFDQSTDSPTSWQWTFQGGTPANSTLEDPTVTYATPGIYTVTLTATNSSGSDTETKTGYITVTASGGGTVVPFSEGFSNATFPPANWEVTNGNSNDTWFRDGSTGIAPTQGNSLAFNNFANNDAPDEDQIFLPKLSFVGATAPKMIFDVAYARYNNTYFDGLEVVISTDCGQTFTSVYSKSGSTLATVPDITTLFTPTDQEWRSDTIDLSSYAGLDGITIAFKNLPNWGNVIYIDNINIGDITIPVSPDFGLSSTTICTGDIITVSDNSIGVTTYNWDFGPGASPATASGPGPHTVSYSTPGSKSIILDANNGGASQTQVVTVSNTPSTPTISSSGGTSFCQGQSLVLTSSASGQETSLWSDGSTSQSITVTSGGTYTVESIGNGGCTSGISQPITVSVLPLPTITVNDATICEGSAATLNASGANNYQWSNGGGSGSSISVSPSTSQNYTVTGTDNNGCVNTAISNVTVNSLPQAPIITTSGSTAICEGSSVFLTSNQTSGILWSSGETVGTIEVSNAGTFYVTYTDANGCSNVSNNVNVQVNPSPVVSLLNSNPYCVNSTAFQLTNGIPSGGVYSGVGVSSGQFDPNQAGVGNHLLTYVYTDSAGCSGTSQNYLVVESCASIDEIDGATIQLYPNPTSDVLTIESGEAFERIVLTDQTGRVVFEEEFTSPKTEVEINLQDLTNGMYHIHISGNDKEFIKEIVKQ